MRGFFLHAIARPTRPSLSLLNSESYMLLSHASAIRCTNYVLAVVKSQNERARKHLASFDAPFDSLGINRITAERPGSMESTCS